MKLLTDRQMPEKNALLGGYLTFDETEGDNVLLDVGR